MLTSMMAVLCVSSSVWASSTSAYAAINKSGHGADNDSDSDSALGYCQSYACADCPFVNDASWASTTSTVNVSWTPGSGYSKVISTSITANNNEPTQYSGHTFTNNGSATFWDTNARLIGQGLQAQCQYSLHNLNIAIPLIGSRTLGMNLSIDSSPICVGTATLSASGPGSGDYSLSCTGFLADSFFDVFFDSASQTWQAEYNHGPGSIMVPVAVDSFFDIFVELSVTGDGVGGDTLNQNQVSFMVPPEYQFMPEPMTIVLLLLGMPGLRRQR